MRRFALFSIFAAALFGVTGWTALGDEEPPAAPASVAADERPKEAPAEASPAPPTDPAEIKAAQQEYDQTVAEWKTALKDLRSLQVRYKGASESERATMRTKYQSEVESTRTIIPRLRSATERLYRVKPKGNPELQEFLSALLLQRVSSYDFAEARRLAGALLAGGQTEGQLYLLDGVSAFALNQFDDAGKLLREANKRGVVSRSSDSSTLLFNECMARGSDYLRELSNYREYWAQEEKLRAAEAEADDLPRVKFETTAGELVLELFENEAPNTVANFITLVDQGFYNGTKFHRVLPMFMAQGGDPLGNGQGGPGYRIRCECERPDHRQHFAGTLSMAHAGKDTGGSQFFLTFVPTPHLNGKHTVFGRVISGHETLGKIHLVDPVNQEANSHPPDEITKATVIRKRDHAYTPEKLPLDKRGGGGMGF